MAFIVLPVLAKRAGKDIPKESSTDGLVWVLALYEQEFKIQ